MKLNNHRNLLLVMLWGCLCLSFPASGAAEGGPRPPKHREETRYTVIHFDRAEDLGELNSRIGYASQEWYLDRLHRPQNPERPLPSVKRKMDAIFERVQQILDMRKRFQKVNVMVYPNRAGLEEAYSALTGEKCRVRAWYVYEGNSIHVNAEDVNEGILAHEMAHAVIDHYLTVRPPRAASEILARYVDEHLHEEGLRVPAAKGARQ